MIQQRVVDEGRLTSLSRTRAVAEAAEWSAMLDYAIREEADVNASEKTEFAKQASISVIAIEIGAATGLSEHQVHRRLTAAQWVKRFIARVEADLHEERANDERLAAAIDKRLTTEAKAFGADDERGTQQRRADLPAAWLTTNDARAAAIGADIAVTINADALAGKSDHRSGEARRPGSGEAATERDEGARPGQHRILTDPAGGT